MRKYEVLDRLVEEGNGYLLTAKALDNNVSKQTLAKYVSDRCMSRVAHGVYLSGDAWPDDYYLLFLRNRRIVFSMESSLYLHGLTDREPVRTTVTVPEGYNSTHVHDVRVIHIKKEWYDMGLSKIQTGFGNEVPVYDTERTICDIIRAKNNVEIQTFQTAMRGYMSMRGKNLGNLIRYAQSLGIEEKVRTYTEVML